MKCLFSSSSKQKKPRRAGEQFKMGQGLRVWCPFVAFCEVGKLPNARSLLSLMDVQTSPEPHPCQPVKGSNPVSGNYHVGLTGDMYKWWTTMNHSITLGLCPSPQRRHPIWTQGRGVCGCLEMEQWLYTQNFRQILTQIDISLNTFLRKAIRLPNQS